MNGTEKEDRNVEGLKKRIREIKERWGKRLLLLGHYYQKPEILEFADFIGDSFQLSKEAAASEGCDAIVFCGVHFMAETADILANAPNRLALRERPVEVLIPDLTAGCPMADMADLSEVEEVWARLGEVIDVNEVAPVTYVNSSAAIKAFCGDRNGFACTSSNAAKVLSRALSERKRVLFLPDQQLGRNVALAMGIPREEIVLWNSANAMMIAKVKRLESEGFLPEGTGERIIELSRKPFGGNSEEAIQNAKVILWNGFCPVHQRFTLSDIDRFRKDHPGGQVIVHPECPESVVSGADQSGSTKRILDSVTGGAPGSVWGIGTERRMVESLAARFTDREVYPLSPAKPLCPMMNKITLEGLCRSMESLEGEELIYPVRVEESIASGARLALNRMLECQ